MPSLCSGGPGDGRLDHGGMDSKACTAVSTSATWTAPHLAVSSCAMLVRSYTGNVDVDLSIIPSGSLDGKAVSINLPLQLHEKAIAVAHRARHALSEACNLPAAVAGGKHDAIALHAIAAITTGDTFQLCLDLRSQGFAERSHVARHAARALTGSCSASRFKITYTVRCGSQQEDDVSPTSVPWLDRYLDALCHITLRLSRATDQCTVAEMVQMPLSRGLREIWTTNMDVAEAPHTTLHAMFAIQAQLRPKAIAVDAWDGRLTYGELDRLSTRLAHLIQRSGVSAQRCIALQLGRSRWLVVGMLAVWKAGSAFAPLDPDWPVARRNHVLHLTKCHLMLASASTPLDDNPDPRFAALRLPDCLELTATAHDAGSVRPQVDPSNAAYILFTSGSTGEPKGVVIDHHSIVIALRSNGTMLGVSESTRMLQFAAPTFDISIAEIWGTLIFGGCVLVPSDADRKTWLPEYIMQNRVNHAVLTPTMARSLAPEEVPCLRTLVLGGEAVLRADVRRWKGVPNFFNGFGPTECAVCCALQRISETEAAAPAIGRLQGVPLWVVDPTDHNILSPIGAVGELIVEGLTVGRGYLGDEQSTAEAFLANPSWLTSGCGEGFPGRQGRIYKTGDLVRYDETGTLRYVGRKAGDLQVKVRGQRLDLGEVESHLRNHCESTTGAQAVVVGVARDAGARATNTKTLAAVLCYSSEATPVSGDPDLVMMSPAEAAPMQAYLTTQLPAYAVPTTFVRISALPTTASDKVDRRRIRTLVEGLLGASRDQVTSNNTAVRRPNTERARSLRDIWASVLQIPVEQLGLDDNFLRLGGDSMTAIAVVREARLRLKLHVTIGQLFQLPTLEEVSAAATSMSAGAEEPISALGLLQAEDVDTAQLRHDLAAACGLQGPTSVLEAYPCTPLQEVFLSLSSRHIGAYTIQKVLRLHDGVDLKRFMGAWAEVARQTSILTTRITQHARFGLLNVVSSDPIEWTEVSVADLDAYLQRDREMPMSTDQSLVRCAVAHAKSSANDEGAAQYFVCTMHHALYDAWCMPLLWDRVLRAFRGKHLARASFAPFIEWCRSDTDQQSARSYWMQALQDSHSTTLFPAVPASIDEVCEDSRLEHCWSLPRRSGSKITKANLLAAAWALVAGHYSGSHDVLFGVTVSGRNAPVVGIDQVIGPTIATVPQRVQYRANQSVSELLQAVQDAAVDRIPFEQTGLAQISAYSPDTQKVRDIQTFIVVQPAEYGNDNLEEVGHWVTGPGNYRFDASALTLEVFLEQGNIRCVATFDSRVVEHHIVKRCLSQLAHVSQQLNTASPEAAVGSVQVLTAADMQEIRGLNSDLLQPVPDALPHHDIAMQVQMQPMAPAVHAHDRVLSYGQLWTESGRLAQRLLAYHVGPGNHIPFMLQPSSWVVVSMIAILRTGASFVPISPDLPDARIEQVLRKLDFPTYLLSSALPGRKAFGDTADAILLPPSQADVPDSVIPEAVEPDSAAWIIFTSGSTGTPKGVIISHAAAHTSFRNLGKTFDLGPRSRTLQFSSLAFDACVLEIIGTLMHGGCVCIPPSHAQQSTADLPAALQALRVNTAILTPSVARQLTPGDMTGLDTLILTGEAPTQQDLDRWRHVPRLFNAYGPAECSNMCAVRRISSTAEDARCIGSLSGVANWVVHPEDSNHLSPIGGVGELVVGGATVGSGYLRDARQSAAAFVQNLAWLAPGPPGAPRPERLYRTGDLVRLDADGCLTYHGRKDGQVKLRGQRVELGDIEHHMMRGEGTLEAAAEVVEVGMASREDGQQQRLLVGFLRRHGDGAASDGPVLCPSHAVIAALEATLPRHMVPSYVVCVPSMPRTLSGKRDGATLRATARALIEAHWRERGLVSTSSTSKRAPRTWAERVLVQAWEQALGARVARGAIGLDDDFVQLGGSSIEALHVVSACRRMGMALRVADVLRFRGLEAQAGQGQRMEKAAAHDEQRESFSLVASHAVHEREQLRAALAAACRVPADAVQDAYPCVPLQVALLSATARDVHAGAYVLRHVFAMPAHVDAQRVKQAWAEVVRATDVLRTRIVRHPTAGWLQVVLAEDMRWREGEGGDDDDDDDDDDMPMALNRPLSRFHTLAHGGSNGGAAGWTLVWTIHHAIADGWTLELILGHVRRRLSGAAPPASRAFRHFVHWFCRRRDEERALHYWRHHLAGVQVSPFPPRRTRDAATAAPVMVDAAAQHRFHVPIAGHATFATLARATWALVQSRHAMSRDVVFAEVRSGRTVDVPEADVIVGPMITTTPFRARLDEGGTVGSLLAWVHQVAVGSIAHEHVGLRQIARISDDCAAACAAAQTLIAIQPAPRPRGSGADRLFREAPHYRLLDYPLCIEIVPEEEPARHVALHARFCSHIVDAAHVRRLLRQFAHAWAQLATLPADTPLSQVSILPPDETEHIWALSASASPTALPPQRSLPEAVRQHAEQRPHAAAIQAWDGDLTYSELLQLSLALARRLRRHGAGTVHRFVPWYVEKSRWAIVAFLAILYTGAAVVSLDAAHPVARTDMCLSSLPRAAHGSPAAAGIAVVSANLASRWRHAWPDVHVIELCDGLFDRLRADSAPEERHRADDASSALLPVEPSRPCWVLFTSGSTGTPKGVVIEHGSAAIAFPLLARALQLDTSTRMLHFASHAFDLCTWEICTPLLVGGTLVVPSEAQRLQSLPAFCAQFRPNVACLTPAVLRLYSPAALPSLQVLLVGGAAPSEKDFETWRHVPALYNAYGPTEATVISALSRVSGESPARTVGRLGRLPGIELWVCDPIHPHALAPIGAVGELVIASPTLARGYLDVGETADAFVDNPDWLAQGVPGVRPGKHARVYRTGDLVRLHEDGHLTYMGRRDKQVKIRGQRVELDEIACAILECVPEIASTAVIVECTGSQKLVAFVLPQKPRSDDAGATAPCSLYTLPGAAEARLRGRLPTYMQPQAWIEVDELPLTTAGKTDDDKLQQWAKTLREREVDRKRKADKCMPATALEKALQQSWGQVLGLDEDVIDLDTNFFGVGGDSISALELIVSLGRHGMELAMTDLYQNPVLRDMANYLQSRAPSKPVLPAAEQILPFSLLSRAVGAKQLISDVATLCGTVSENIEDIYPCTAMQAGLLAVTAQHPGAYVSCYVLELGPEHDLSRFRSAWQSLLRVMPILRTRALAHPSAGFLQVVIRPEHADAVKCPEMGASCTWQLTPAHDGRPARFVLRIHHALYDRITLQHVVDGLDSLYQGTGMRALGDYRLFIKHTSSRDLLASEDYWRRTLADVHASVFPLVPATMSNVIANETFTSCFTFPPVPNTVTRANLLRAAWGLAVSWFTGQEDVIFGDVRSGRDADLADIERLPGPTIATVPLHVCAKGSSSVGQYLQRVQHQVSSTGPHEQMGLHRIQRLSGSCADACRFQTLFNVHIGQVRTRPQADDADASAGLPAWSVDAGFVMRSIALVVEPTIERDRPDYTVEVSFDGRVITAWTLGKVVGLFGSLVTQLATSAADDALKLCEIQTIRDADRRQLSGEQGTLRGRSWLVLPQDPSRLAPMGAVGELVFEHKEHVRHGHPPFEVHHKARCNNGILWSNGELARYEPGQGFVHVGWKARADERPRTASESRGFRPDSGDPAATTHEAQIMSKPRTNTEILMAGLWAELLTLDAHTIMREHSFFSLGGDSVSSILLVSKCRAHGLPISVPDLLRGSRLMDLAATAVEMMSAAPRASDLPFSLLFEEEDMNAPLETFLATSVIPAVGCARNQIEDVLPCTYMQEEFLHLDGLQHHLQLAFGAADIDSAVLEKAVRSLFNRHSALRTVFTHSDEHGYVQIILRSSDAEAYREMEVSEDESINRAAEKLIELAGTSQQLPFTQMPRFILLSRSHDGGKERSLLIQNLSHAQFDGFSMPSIVRDLAALYEGIENACTEPFPPASQFSEIVYARSHVPAAKVRMHWMRLLSRASPGTVLTRSLSVQQREAEPPCVSSRVVIERHVPLATWDKIRKSAKVSQAHVTYEDILTATWALAIACVGQADDVLFGRVVNGRRAIPKEIAYGEGIVGPLMNILPVRVELRAHQKKADPAVGSKAARQPTLGDMISAVATQNAQSAAYEHTDLDEIATQFAAPGLWQENPSVSGSRRRFRWNSIVVWQDYRRLQTVDDVLPAPDTPSTSSDESNNIARGYMSPFASSSQINFAGRNCFVTSTVPAPDLADMVTVGRIPDDVRDTVSLVLEYVPGAIASHTAQRLVQTMVAIINAMSVEPDVPLHELVSKLLRSGS